jgi:hypothetical protein
VVFGTSQVQRQQTGGLEGYFIDYLAKLTVQAPGVSDLLAESFKERNILFIIIYMQIISRGESEYYYIYKIGENYN